MTNIDAYEILMERLEFPGSTRLRRALEATITPEQALMIVELPGNAELVAGKTGIAPERVKEQLDELFFKGVIFPRGGNFDNRETYRFARSIGVLRDSVCSNPPAWDLPKDHQFFEIWYDFSAHEMYPQHAKDRQAKGGSPNLRIVPAYKSIKDLPGVLPCEDFHQLLAAQELIVVVPCPCRYIHGAGGHPCQHTREEEHWECFQFAQSARYALKLGKAKKLSLDEALALSDIIEDDGILHIWYSNDTSMATVKWSCQCCVDCCTVVVPLVQAGLPLTNGWVKSRYVAYDANVDDCNGCQVCIDRCQFDAIEMKRVEGSKKLKAVVDAEKCFGCGVCVVGCEPEALKMKVVRPPDHIPAAAG